MSTVDLIILFAYIVGMLVIGFYAKGKIETMDDFVLGGKRFGFLPMLGTILATMVGSGMMMGAVGNSYKNGILGGTFWMYLGFGVGLIVFSLMTKSIRKTESRSLSELLSKAFGVKVRVVSAIVVITYAVALVAINIAGMRTMILYIFGDKIGLSLAMATVIAALIAIVYTALGGFFAVVWTDTVQFLIMITCVIILGPIIGLTATGGFENVSQAYVSEGLSMTNPGLKGVAAWQIGLMLAYFLTVPADPTMPQRALSAKDNKTAKRAFMTSGIIGLYFGIAILLIGGAAHMLMPGIEKVDTVLPAFVLEYYPPVLRGLTIAGIFAAIMSSFDSFLILATTHIVYDIGKVVKPNLKDDTVKKVLPFATVVIGVLGIIIALFITSLFEYLAMVFSIVGSALAPPLVAALFFKKWTSSLAALLSVIVGTIIPAYLFLTKGYDVWLGDPVFSGLIGSIVVLVIVSLITRGKKAKEVTEVEKIAES